MLESEFPPGTPVCVKQAVDRRDGPIEVDVAGVVEAWDKAPTGSWFAHADDGKLPLLRLKLRKVDGELTLLIIDNSTTIARIEAGTAI